MKTKPIPGKIKPLLIILACFIVIVCAFFFVRFKYFGKAEKGDITLFLTNFNSALKGGHTDTVLNYFETPKNPKAVRLLISLLAGETGLNGKSAATFKVTFNPQDNKILYSNSEITVVRVPVSFFGDSVAEKISSITFTIHKTGDHLYKIIKVKSDLFVKDYIAYERLIRNKTVPAADIYSAITLASFKTAASLKASYDSVLWFEHVGDKTYYYVIKGTLNDKFYYADDRERGADYEPTYKMGLVGPNLNEIIPPEYDLIHNIGGTIAGTIEVEKAGKRGLYNIAGKIVLPVTYDQIFPLVNDDNIALLRSGDDYFYLKSDTTVSDKIADLKIADMLPKIKTFGSSYSLPDESSKNIMEYNDLESSITLVMPPSYLVDMHILPQFLNFQNPLRKLTADDEGDGDGSLTVDIKFDGEKEEDGNWFKTAFYSLYDDYLGARSGLYEGKKVLMVDKKQNRILGFDAGSYYGLAEGGGDLSGLCNENSFRAINDTLFEFRTTSEFDQPLLNGKHLMSEGPYFYYLHIKNGKLVALPNTRLFGCTKYIKLDDSYLQGCYVMNQISDEPRSRFQKGTAIDHATLEILQYMKNEIYASYGYYFKNPAWNDAFEGRFTKGDSLNTHINDSLTAIDKYNVNWLNQKIKSQGAKTVALQ